MTTAAAMETMLKKRCSVDRAIATLSTTVRKEHVWVYSPPATHRAFTVREGEADENDRTDPDHCHHRTRGLVTAGYRTRTADGDGIQVRGRHGAAGDLVGRSRPAGHVADHAPV